MVDIPKWAKLWGSEGRLPMIKKENERLCPKSAISSFLTPRLNGFSNFKRFRHYRSLYSAVNFDIPLCLRGNNSRNAIFQCLLLCRCRLHFLAWHW